MYTNVIGLNPGDISQIKVKINIQTTFNSEHQNSEAYSHHQTQFPNIKPYALKLSPSLAREWTHFSGMDVKSDSFSRMKKQLRRTNVQK